MKVQSADVALDYPSAGHLLRHLRIRLAIDDAGIVLRAPMQPGLLDHEGHLRIGAFGALADMIGGAVGISAVTPSRVVTVHMDLHRIRRPLGETLELRSALLRKGRKTLVQSIRVLGEGDDPIPVAEGLLSFAILPSRGEPWDHPLEAGEVGSWSVDFSTPESGLSAGDDPMRDLLRLRPIPDEPGAFETTLTPDLSNSLGAFHGAAATIMMELSAEALAEETLGGVAAVSSLSAHYLAQGRVGPVRCRPRWLRPPSREERCPVVQLELRDAGAEDRLMALAHAVITPKT